MEYETEIISIKARLDEDEKRLQAHSERLHSLQSVQTLETGRVSALKEEMKTVKTTLDEISSTFKVMSDRDLRIDYEIKRMTKWLIRIGCLAVGAIIFVGVRNENTASVIMSLASSLAKFGI